MRCVERVPRCSGDASETIGVMKMKTIQTLFLLLVVFPISGYSQIFRQSDKALLLPDGMTKVESNYVGSNAYGQLVESGSIPKSGSSDSNGSMSVTVYHYDKDAFDAIKSSYATQIKAWQSIMTASWESTGTLVTKRDKPTFADLDGGRSAFFTTDLLADSPPYHNYDYLWHGLLNSSAVDISVTSYESLAVAKAYLKTIMGKALALDYRSIK